MSDARLTSLGLWFLLTCVLWTCAGVTQVSTREGEDAILPCATESPVDLRGKAFDWKTGRKDVFMYVGGKHYKNGKLGQDPQFKDRVQFHPECLQAGNASLILSNVTKRGSGEYECILFLTRQTRQTRSVNLTVVVEPQLSLEVKEAPPSSGWVLLSCLSRGGQPPPSGLEWHFPNGTVIPEGEAPTANSSYSDGCSSISQSVKVREPGTYTCLARQQGVRPAVRDIPVFGYWLTGNVEAVSWNGTWTSICVILFILLMLSFGAIYQCCTRKKKKKVDSEVKFIKAPNCDV